jgi:hypothetical protein
MSTHLLLLFSPDYLSLVVFCWAIFNSPVSWELKKKRERIEKWQGLAWPGGSQPPTQDIEI